MTTVHPTQPFVNADGVIRFNANAIVQYLLDAGPFDMNHLALQSFTDEDRCQFAQLIGYSASGYCELSYATDEEADRIYHASQDFLDRRICPEPASPDEVGAVTSAMASLTGTGESVPTSEATTAAPTASRPSRLGGSNPRTGSTDHVAGGRA